MRHVFRVADDADRRPARRRHAANFTAGQVDLRPIGVASGQRRANARRPAQHAAATRHHLDVVNVHAQRNRRQRQAVAHRRPAHPRRSSPGRPPSDRRAPECIASRRRRSATTQCGHVRFGSYWIESTFAGTPSLLRRKSIMPELPLVTAATMPRGDLALVVASALALLRPKQTLRRLGARRQLGEVAHGRAAAARRRRIVFANTHGSFQLSAFSFQLSALSHS